MWSMLAFIPRLTCWMAPSAFSCISPAMRPSGAVAAAKAPSIESASWMRSVCRLLSPMRWQLSV